MKRWHPAGFTLLEILLVLLLMAISAVVVVPNFYHGQSDEAKEEAQRFYLLMQLWTEQALITGQTFGLRVDDDRYTLLKLTPDDWQPITDGSYAKAITMPEGIKLSLEVTGFVAEEDRLFDRENLFDDDMFAEEENYVEPPQIVLMGNGEIIPFSLVFLVDEEPLWQVEGNDVAMFDVNALNEDKE